MEKQEITLTDPVVVTDESQTASSEQESQVLIEVLIEGEGISEIEVFKVPHGRRMTEVVALVAKRGGFATEEALLFLEDCEEPLDAAVVIIDEASRGRVHHVHRARQIEVYVYYQGSQKEHRFAPSTRVLRVLDWAVGPEGFNIDPAIAPEMELALHGETKALPKNAHVGRFVRGHSHKVAFDLVRGVVPNGGSQ